MSCLFNSETAWLLTCDFGHQCNCSPTDNDDPSPKRTPWPTDPTVLPISKPFRFKSPAAPACKFCNGAHLWAWRCHIEHTSVTSSNPAPFSPTNLGAPGHHFLGMTPQTFTESGHKAAASSLNPASPLQEGFAKNRKPGNQTELTSWTLKFLQTEELTSINEWASALDRTESMEFFAHLLLQPLVKLCFYWTTWTSNVNLGYQYLSIYNMLDFQVAHGQSRL